MRYHNISIITRYLVVINNVERIVKRVESNLGWPVQLHRVSLKSDQSCHQEYYSVTSSLHYYKTLVTRYYSPFTTLL